MARYSFIRWIALAALSALWSPASNAQQPTKAAEVAEAAYARAAFRLAVDSIEKKNGQSLAMQWLSRSFEKGYEHPSDVLREPAFKPLRDDPLRRSELRKLMGSHARESQVEMVASDEKGEQILLELELVEKESGKPLPDTRVYLYHTDADGDYAPDAESPGGGSENPRLFAFVRSDSKGCVTITSILPGSYRGTQAPRHIHLQVDREDSSTYGTGIYFDSEAPLDDELRDEAASGRISAVQLDSDKKPYRGRAQIRVPRG